MKTKDLSTKVTAKIPIRPSHRGSGLRDHSILDRGGSQRYHIFHYLRNQPFLKDLCLVQMFNPTFIPVITGVDENVIGSV